MALFVIQHRHKAEVCPAPDPQIAPMLAKHVSQANAAAYGIRLHGEAVVEGSHTLHLIVDAPGPDKVKEFMGPFYQFGSVKYLSLIHI